MNCTCRTRRLGGRMHKVLDPACPEHGDVAKKAEQDEATRQKLELIWANAYEAGWSDRNRIALGIHNRPRTPNPYRKVSPE